MNILIADPDQEFVSILTYWLHRRGHQTRIARDAHEALQLWREAAPDLALIDLALPETGGAEFCHHLRQTGNGLILVLTESTHEEEEVYALEQGADDYLRKPVSMRQVQARITALARRARPATSTPPGSLVKIGPTSVNLTHYEVTRDGRRYRLTPTEGRLLQFLLANANQVVSASAILQHVWGYESSEPHLIKTHIHHLRRKIEPDPNHPRFLLTFPSSGYLLRLHEQETENGPPTPNTGGQSAIAFLEPRHQLFSKGA